MNCFKVLGGLQKYYVHAAMCVYFYASVGEGGGRASKIFEVQRGGGFQY